MYYCSSLAKNITLPKISYEPIIFSSDYGLRTYTAGCYYLDASNTWQSDGLTVSGRIDKFYIEIFDVFSQVGSLTNIYQTQCFSTHLTTFAGGFFPLPVTVNWQRVFANADFSRNKLTK